MWNISRMPDFNSEVITISVAKKVTKKIYVVEYPKKVKTTTGTGGVFMAQHMMEIICLLRHQLSSVYNVI